MNTERPTVLTVSNSDQYRETLAIMLDSEFHVTAISGLEGPLSLPDVPSVVVLSPTSWDERLPAAVKSTWPKARLVFIDPPPMVCEAFPHAARTSWSDPFAVRDAVAVEAVASHGTALATGALPYAELLPLAQADLGRRFKVSLTLARLAQTTESSASFFITMRILGEQVGALVERLHWVDIAELDRPSETVTTDLAAALRHAIHEKEIRFFCRGLPVGWQQKTPFMIHCPTAFAEVLARCARSYLLELRPPAPIEIEVGGSIMVFRHPGISATVTSISKVTLERLLLMVGSRLHAEPGCIKVYSGSS